MEIYIDTNTVKLYFMWTVKFCVNLEVYLSSALVCSNAKFCKFLTPVRWCLTRPGTFGQMIVVLARGYERVKRNRPLENRVRDVASVVPVLNQG